MIEKLFDGLYRIELPLPDSPLRTMNAYLVRGNGRDLLIDTGMGRRTCREALREAFRNLTVDAGRLDFFITHIHADHIGLLAELAAPKATIYFNRIEPQFVFSDAAWHRACDEALLHGFPAADLDIMRRAHPSRRFGFRGGAQGNFHLVADGDVLAVGDHRFRCLETPGHSPGHTCLYDAERKLLVSGDHILAGISSYIGSMGILRLEDALGKYFDSLERTRRLQVDLVLPGHRDPFGDHRDRIDELVRHHRSRLDEILDLLARHGHLSAWQAASLMTWDFHGAWADFPIQQKWFAASEALSHLLYLEKRGRLERLESDSLRVFRPSDRMPGVGWKKD